MGAGNKKEKDKKVEAAASTSQDALYANDPDMHKDENGDWVYEGSKQSTTLNGDENKATEPTYLSKLLSTKSEAVNNATTAKTAYDNAYNELGDAYKAIAETMKPKDRTEEQKRLRNVALAQAIGQGLSAIFGGIYANSKKGRGKIVMPEDFASKTLAKAEELREKGLLEEKEFSKILSDMNLRKAELNAKKASEDYTAKKVAADKAQAAIADYLKELDTRAYKSSESQKDRDAADKRATSAQEFQAAQTKSSQAHQAAENEKARQHQMVIKNLELQAKRDGVFAGADGDTISMAAAFLPTTRREKREKLNENGDKIYYYEQVPIQSWEEDEYKSALYQANMAKTILGPEYAKKLNQSGRLNEIHKLLKAKGKSWQQVKKALDNNYTAENIIAELKK